MQFNFYYSPEYELWRVQYTLFRTHFYKDNNYVPTFPPGISFENCGFTHVLEAVRRDYDEGYFAAYKEQLLMKCSEHADIVSQMERAGLIRTGVPYMVYLTKYGVGGSYGPPDEVVIKVKQPEVTDRDLGTFLHELIHLHIQDWVVKYNLTHWQKERMVDLIGLQFFPTLRNAQNITEDVSGVDRAFSAQYPDIEKVIAEVGKSA